MILGNESINFGEIIQGEKVDLEFRIKNTGNGDLIITNAKASCGCTQLEYPKDKDPREQLFKYAIDSRWIITEMSPHSVNLESIFRNLTMEDSTDA